MNQFIIFIGGFLVGIYADQNYKIPNIGKYVKQFESHLKKHEKNEKN